MYNKKSYYFMKWRLNPWMQSCMVNVYPTSKIIFNLSLETTIHRLFSSFWAEYIWIIQLWRFYPSKYLKKQNIHGLKLTSFFAKIGPRIYGLILLYSHAHHCSLVSYSLSSTLTPFLPTPRYIIPVSANYHRLNLVSAHTRHLSPVSANSTLP